MNMHRASHWACLLALLCAAPSAEGRAPPQDDAPAATAELLPDGTELVVVPQTGVATASLRLVVRSGASRDPIGKEGLAHLLEHLVFHGSHDLVGSELRGRVEAVGGTLNAFTSAQSTVYALDAPAKDFPALARDVLRMVTSPEIPGGKRLERELGIIQTESVYHFSRASLSSHVEEALFQSVSLENAIIGTVESRARITRDDLLAFYTRHYVTSNISLVLTGATNVEEARRLVDTAYRLPPALPEEAVSAATEMALYPVEQHTRAPSTFIAQGYPISHEDRGTCRAVADLIQLRLVREVHLKEPIVSSMRVLCINLRGNDLLLAFAYTRSLDGARLPYLMQETFDTLARRPPSAPERKLLEQRSQRLSELLLAEGPALADTVAALASEPRQGGLVDLGALQPTRVPTPAVLKSFVRRNFREDRAVRITSSPLEG
ncbi:M16 family metallopeptidase [Myxococcus sp. Y35]|uniref:M16 family metallopeptidase n=1 Tax=Pseudomyxococcus flavus TaxID=3115648 RepID=UPI003CF47AC0